MRIHQKMAVLLVFSAGAVFSSQLKKENTAVEQIQVTQCLAQHLKSAYPMLAENNEFKIIEMPSKDLDSLSLLADQHNCGRFLNVTQQMLQGENTLTARKALAKKLLTTPTKPTSKVGEPIPITHAEQVFNALGLLKQDNIISTIQHLTNFYNRSATEQTGVDTANWLRDSFLTLAESSQRTDVGVRFVKTGLPYRQRSVVGVIGRGIKAPAVVIGAHMDTLNGRMPGADDDATGAATILEVARIMLESNIKLQRPVYFVWYAAEERGLVGSQQVVNDFIYKSIPVKAVLQLDMTGYRHNQESMMWLFNDYTDPRLTAFLENLIHTYIGVPVGYSGCGYACSDHASWTQKGIPAAFPAESSFEDHNQAIHTSQDTLERLSPEHIKNYAKLALSFVIELAG